MDLDHRTIRALNAIHGRDPDLAHILTELLLKMAAKAPESPSPRLDFSKLTTPQGLLFTIGGGAVLMQLPLPAFIETLKAVVPLLLP